MKLDDSCIYRLAVESINSEIEKHRAELNAYRKEIENINTERMHLRSSGQSNTDHYKDLEKRRRHLIYLSDKTLRKLSSISKDIEPYRLESLKNNYR